MNRNKQALALALVIILIVNLILFAVRMINSFVFWGIIIIIALVSYFYFSTQNIYKQKK